MGKELSTKLTSSLSLLNVRGCSSDLSLNWCVHCCFWPFVLKGGDTLLLRHTDMADNRGFLGWCPLCCSSDSQDVRGL